MTVTAPAQCASCVHLKPDRRTCAAFPAGIPEEILRNELDHREPVEGDGGVRFEQSPVADPFPWGLVGLEEEPMV